MLSKTGRLAEEARKVAVEKRPEGYNKKQLIAASKEVFGGRGTDMFGPVYEPVETLKDVENLRAAMVHVDGRYPASMTNCEVVGINGDCGLDCPVFREGRCEELENLLECLKCDENISKEEKSRVLDLYKMQG